MKKPHLIFIFPDQLRRDALGCEGGPVPTPHIDRLSREGTSFRRAYVSYPMCTPSRATLLTGRPAHSLRSEAGEPYLFNDVQLRTDSTTYAHCLTHAGYQCSYYGKWHNAEERGFVPPGPNRLGFDHGFFGFQCGPPRLEPFHFDDAGNRVEARESWAPFHDTALAIETLTTGHDKAPQMLAISYDPPHEPYDILPPELEHYFAEARQGIDVPENVPTALREQARERLGQYHAQVRGIDMAIGRLLDAVDQLGIANNTIIVLSSDHGDQLLSHGLDGKNQFYEESLNVPLIFRWPGRVEAGRRVEGLVSACDLAPTFLDLVGIRPHKEMLGTSLRPCLCEGEEAPHEAVFAEVDHPWFDWFFGQGWQGKRRCIVTTRYKLVVRAVGVCEAEPWQLFDLETDPGEMENRVSDPGLLPIVTKLGHQLLKWMVETDDPFLDAMLGGMPPHSRETMIQSLRRESRMSHTIFQPTSHANPNA